MGPDRKYVVTYCHEVLPDLLVARYEVVADLAHRVGEDVLNRAEAFAALHERDQEGSSIPRADQSLFIRQGAVQ